MNKKYTLALLSASLICLAQATAWSETVLFSDDFETESVIAGMGSQWLPHGGPNSAFETGEITGADGSDSNLALVFTGTGGVQRAAVRTTPDAIGLGGDARKLRIAVHYRLANPGDILRVILSENDAAEGAIAAEISPVGAGSGVLNLLRLDSADGWGPTVESNVRATVLATLKFEDMAYFSQLGEWNELILEVNAGDTATTYAAMWRSVNRPDSRDLLLEFSDTSAQRLQRPAYALLSIHRNGGAPEIALDNVRLSKD